MKKKNHFSTEIEPKQKSFFFFYSTNNQTHGERRNKERPHDEGGVRRK